MRYAGARPFYFTGTFYETGGTLERARTRARGVEVVQQGASKLSSRIHPLFSLSLSLSPFRNPSEPSTPRGESIRKIKGKSIPGQQARKKEREGGRDRVTWVFLSDVVVVETIL